jgi:hypothetical protein
MSAMGSEFEFINIEAAIAKLLEIVVGCFSSGYCKNSRHGNGGTRQGV